MVIIDAFVSEEKSASAAMAEGIEKRPHQHIILTANAKAGTYPS